MDAKPNGRRAVLSVLVVFLLGLVLGALLGPLVVEQVRGSAEKPRPRRTVVEKLTDEIALTPDQQTQVSAILDETNTKYKAAYEEVRPRFDEIRRQGREKIRAVLSPEQTPKFEEFLRQLDEKRKKREKDRR